MVRGATTGSRLARGLERGARWLGRHWLAVLNLFWGMYVGLALLAPLLMAAGWETPAKVIYLLYRPACHQRPERSFFLGGSQVAYSVEELAAAGIDVDPLARAIGSSTVGFKLAVCERDTALYGSVFAFGLLYAVARKRLRRLRIPFWVCLLFLAPLAIDGSLQLLGLYESTWFVRALTGALFGAGPVLYAYPIIDESMADMNAPRPAPAAGSSPGGA